MNKTAKKVTITISVIAVFVLICVLLSMRPVPNFEEKYAGTDLTVEIAGMERTGARRRFFQTEDHGIHIAAAVFGDEFRHLADGHGIGNDLPQMGIDGGAHTDDIDIAVRL